MSYDPQTPVACDVFPIMGQSNAVGTQDASPYIDLTNDCAVPGTPDSVAGRIFQMRQSANSSTIINADEPLEHGSIITANRSATNSIGFSVAFARWYRDNVLAVGRSILLVPCASGGTGFSNNNWNPGNALYESAVTRTNTAMAKHASNKLIAVLWHQGEADANAGWSASQYTTAFAAMVSDYRGRVTGGAKCRFVMGGLSPTAYGNSVIQGAITNMPSTVAGLSVASSTGLAGGVHFTAAAQRTFGPIFGTAIKSIMPIPTTKFIW